MPYFLCEDQKQNTLTIHWLWLVLLFFRTLRRASDMLSSCFIKRNHVSIWNWVQKYKPRKLSSRKRKVDGFVVDETLLKVGSELVWLWVAIEPANKEILSISISK